MAKRPDRAILAGPFKAADPMTEAEYQAALVALDAERQALAQAFTTSQVYPHWAYHATEPAHLVYSDAEALALGAGWSPTPVAAPVVAPVVTALDPDTVALGSPSFTVRVLGTGFAPDAVIVWNGSDEPTTVVSDTELTTGVNMDTASVATTVPVAVRHGEVLSNDWPFTFTEAMP